MKRINIVESIRNLYFADGSSADKMQGDSGNIKACNIIIEISLFVIFLLLVINYSSIDMNQALILSTMIVLLFLTILFGERNISSTKISGLILGFMVLFSFSIVLGLETRLALADDIILTIPVAEMVLFAINIGWIVKIMIRGELSKSEYEMLLLFLLISGLLCLVALGLHLILDKIYQLNTRNLLEVIRNVLRSVLLFLATSNYIITRQRVKRSAFYSLFSFVMVLLLKLISVI